VQTNVELSRILANLFPLLRAVQPQDLNATLNALATALGGRGEQLGETLDKLDVYLNAIDESLPTLRQDMVKLAQVADTYDVAAPDLIEVLGNVTVTSRTVLDKAKDLDNFFSDLQGLAVTSTRVLKNNGRNIIRVGEVTEPVLRLLAIYSPEFPCLIEGAARYAPRLAKAFGGNQVKQYLEFGTLQYRHYDERDLAQYGEVGHGPWCSGLPHPPVPIGPISFKDGTDMEHEGQQTPPPPTGGRQSASQREALVSGTSSGYAGTAGDQAVVNALLAGKTGRAADAYGALGSLLYGPVVRGGGAS
jgi:phospholipid/cholesterol/gamma-HCH transport system substrate-binding protein